MNRPYLLRNAVLILSVVALSAFISTGCKQQPEAASSSVPASNGIVYIELDSVIAHFDMASDKQNTLMEKQKNSEAEFNAKAQTLQRDVQDLNTKMQKGLITRADAETRAQTLQQQEQNLYALRDQLSNSLAEESAVAQRQILEYINQYLAEYNKDHNYQYILAKQFPGPMLYSDPTLDITAPVIEGLNTKYKSEKK